MSYSSGLLKYRIRIARKKQATEGAFGRGSGGTQYVPKAECWASITFVRGIRAMKEGALDAYDTIMIRMRWIAGVNADCIIEYKGKQYAIQSVKEDYQDNILQIVAVELTEKYIIER